MNEFYNPYQFIPVNGKLNEQFTPTIAFSKIKDGESLGVRHDFWSNKRKSGRIVCSLTLETPTVVGNQHIARAGQETEIEPYQLPDGEYAIPANSLRGMVSSVAETISQSALRVLDEKQYSIRKEVGSGLSAVGYIRKENQGDGQFKYFLRPLSLPTIPKVEVGNSIRYSTKWLKLFGEKSKLSDYLSAYVDGYRNDNRRNRKEYVHFLDRDKLCNNFSHPTYYYAKLHGHLSGLTLKDKVSVDDLALYCKPIRNIAHSFLGQRIIDRDIISQTQFEKLTDDSKLKYTRGVLFVLGIEGREDSIPSTKHHERFIPFPIDKHIDDKELEIPNSVIKHFFRLAKERNKASDDLPYLPHGYNREEFLSDGNMVYFDIDDQGYVTEISYSSIWRKSVDGTIHNAFAKISNNLIPWGYGNRTSLTPAEWLFGVVEGGEKKVDKAKKANINLPTKSKNLASRVRFFDAHCPQALNLKAVPKVSLNILSSPKPPSPALYFRGGPKKYQINHLQDHTPNGRKYYLPHNKANNSEQAWKTHSDEFREQKCLCTPIPAGTTFYFHIDFDNLSNDELHLLRTALHPDPDNGFRHRLGLGKPLGLGSVFINIMGIFCVDHIKRYGEDALVGSENRYTEFYYLDWQDEAASIYPLEHQIQQGMSHATLLDGKLVDKESLAWLTFFGNPDNRDRNVKVHYPLSNNQHINTEETEGFQWFVNNDHRDNPRQSLVPVVIRKPLKTLSCNSTPPRHNAI